MNQQEINELVRCVRADLPAFGSPSPQTVSVPHVLVQLADAWPGPLVQENRRQIDALCRKISMSGALLATYKPDWTKHEDAEPLATAHWPLLLVVLLAWSEVPEAMGPDGQGLSLKCLNAAMSACDRFKSRILNGTIKSSSPAFSPLQSWIDQRLASVVCEVAG